MNNIKESSVKSSTAGKLTKTPSEKDLGDNKPNNCKQFSLITKDQAVEKRLSQTRAQMFANKETSNPLDNSNT